MIGAAPRFLASVRSVGEALLAARCGADVIDLKEPDAGALGAVPEDVQRAVLAALGERRARVSATVGDLPFDADVLVPAVARTAATGVDFVKFGVFARGEAARRGFGWLHRRLLAAPLPARLVVLFLADRLDGIDEAIALAKLALALPGVAGVMLDTADKASGALPDILAPRQLARFVAAAHDAGAFAGLAGSLRIEHIEDLAATGADLLGFRGALCGGSRRGRIDEHRLAAVRERIALSEEIVPCS